MRLDDLGWLIEPELKEMRVDLPQDADGVLYVEVEND
jgi:hypothetical protein